jgi:hypothetical protein
MGLFDTIAGWFAGSSVPAPAAAPQVPVCAPVPQELPKVSARTAAELCRECKPDAAAMQLLTPQQTPAQFLAVLQERHLAADMVKVLAQGLPDREGVAWAVQCVLKVADKLPPADALAMRAAQAWVKNPTPELKAAAAAAAQRTDYQGPGAWAAQAAASAQTGAPAPQPVTPGEMAPPRLTPHAVGGAVLLSSSLLACPGYAARLLPAMQVAVGAAAGMAVAAGMNHPHLSGAAANLHGPASNVPGAPAVPHVAVPQLPGAAGKVQAGLGTMPSVPSAGGMTASAASLPAVAGAMSSPAGMIAQGAAAGGAAGAAAAAMGSIPVLHAASATAAGMAVPVPGAAGLAGMALPHAQTPALAHAGLSSASPPNIPQLPSTPPPDPAAVFRGQQPFIEIGLGIASGKLPLM